MRSFLLCSEEVCAEVFQFEEAAKIAGYKKPEVYAFDPSTFNGYKHTMTHEDESAIDEYNSFSTWVFMLE